MIGPDNKRRFVLCGLVLLCLFYGRMESMTGAPTPALVPAILNTAEARLKIMPDKDPLVPMLSKDPLAFLQSARTQYDRSIRSYSCLFTKQELLNGELTEEQTSEIKFRETPFSVYMHMVKNAGRARRVIFVTDKFVENGEQFAVVQPENPVFRFLASSVKRPITGADARKASRRSIEEFGFKRSLDLIIKYAVLSKQEGQLDLRYVGEGEVDGRPTYIFERRLPESDRWPDALLIVHLDQQWRLPVACFSYADRDAEQLLGKYIYTDVRLNIGLSDADFEAETYGL